MDLSLLHYCKQTAFPALSILEKATVRKKLRQKRAEQDARVIHVKSRRIADAVQVLPEWRKAKWIAAYASLNEEVQTDALLAASLADGKYLVLPKVEVKRLRLFRITDPERDLVGSGSFGIREPVPDRCEEIPANQIDLFLTPGVGFDCFGSRIGFGGGFYDRLLVNKRNDAKVIGLGFEFQVVHALPTARDDYPVDLIVTEENLYQPNLSFFTSNSEMETQRLAQALYQNGLKEGGVMALHGDLGVGKTMFVKALANAMGIVEDASSPTFVFCREYHGDIMLYHIDCYRLDTLRSAEEDYWAELLEQKGLIAIEWAEKLNTLPPKKTVHLCGTILDQERRKWSLFTPLRNQLTLHQAKK
jgi:5-formyltetrahydrofolate cyclo-ligase